MADVAPTPEAPAAPPAPPTIVDELAARFGGVTEQATADGTPTVWVGQDQIVDALRFLKEGVADPYRFLFDVTAIDERLRTQRQGQPASDTTVVYHLMSYGRNAQVRLKVPTFGDTPSVPSAWPVFKNSNWYEREAFDMFGVRFDGHPDLRRILMPRTWKGHPLRKDHPARATEAGPFSISDEEVEAEQRELQFNPSAYGLKPKKGDDEFMFLNLGPHHPGTHGILRIVLQLDGEDIVQAVPDIGFHHRGAEKMGERQTWHSYIPYTDRVDYFSGVQNNLGYLLSVEKLAGIQVPERAQTIRVMMCEVFRIISHLVWYGTFAGDLGALSPVFYMFTDREKAFDIVEAVTGGRMHPAWFRLGGVAQDLPNGWDRLIQDFLDYLPAKLDEYDKLVLNGKILRARTEGIGEYTLDEAIEWGVTGAGLRAAGLEWDWRKKRPYSGYENFTFDVPTSTRSDCWHRAKVRVAEMRESLRIIRQCKDNMPAGSYKADHPLAMPPRKERTMKDIETLIHHFLGVSWGPVMPAGEACVPIESSKGATGWYVVSDGAAMSYRTRIRTPSFCHMQMIPWIAPGHSIADLMAILAAMDFILADMDR
jgi:NADH-quinone oxidoreductase subunit C/D